MESVKVFLLQMPKILSFSLDELPKSSYFFCKVFVLIFAQYFDWSNLTINSLTPRNVKQTLLIARH